MYCGPILDQSSPWPNTNTVEHQAVKGFRSSLQFAFAWLQNTQQVFQDLLSSHGMHVQIPPTAAKRSAPQNTITTPEPQLDPSIRASFGSAGSLQELQLSHRFPLQYQANRAVSKACAKDSVHRISDSHRRRPLHTPGNGSSTHAQHGRNAIVRAEDVGGFLQ